MAGARAPAIMPDAIAPTPDAISDAIVAQNARQDAADATDAIALAKYFEDLSFPAHPLAPVAIVIQVSVAELNPN